MKHTRTYTHIHRKKRHRKRTKTITNTNSHLEKHKRKHHTHKYTYIHTFGDTQKKKSSHFTPTYTKKKENLNSFLNKTFITTYKPINTGGHISNIL
uniref:Uncharacterized protein n=1 Tax=Octopus bimaculoides TaxID=37653 RepID=A0A0L8HLC6_OCTBM